MQLPPMPDGLTAAWLSEALQQQGRIGADIRISRLTQSQVGDGSGMMSELARLEIDWKRPAPGLPASLIAKFPSRNPTNRQVAMSYHLYERETRYFRELAPRVGADTPAIWLSLLDGDNFLILMEDLNDYRLGDQIAGSGLADTRVTVQALADLHGAFWGQVDDLDWVPGVANSYHAANMASLSASGWDNMCDIFKDFLDPAIAPLGARFGTALPQLQAAMQQPPVTLLHGDFRLENLFFATQPAQQPLAIIDWQGPLIGKGVVDLALMLGQNTQSSVRLAHERALVSHYAELLAAAGVTHYGADQAWSDYKIALLYNWVYVSVVAGALDVHNAHAFAWMSRMVARQSRASNDLALFDLLP